MARRRKLMGRPLLLATGAAMVIGCGGVKTADPPPPPGNLMPPPSNEVEICVDTTPPDSRVVVRAIQEHTFTSRCQTVEAYSSVEITVSKSGYTPKTTQELVSPGTNTFKVDLGDVMAPMGNLMAPPKLTRELCVETTPENAMVEFSGAQVLVPAGGKCALIEDGNSVTVEVSALGYVSKKKVVDLSKGEAKVSVTLDAVPVPDRKPPDRPVGNLMPPPEFPGVPEDSL